jgi:hypothetical protein
VVLLSHAANTNTRAVTDRVDKIFIDISLIIK